MSEVFKVDKQTSVMDVQLAHLLHVQGPVFAALPDRFDLSPKLLHVNPAVQIEPVHLDRPEPAVARWVV